MSDQLLNFKYDAIEPQRLDKFLVICVPDFSRSRLQGLIQDGFVTVNGAPAKKAGQAIETGDENGQRYQRTQA